MLMKLEKDNDWDFSNRGILRQSKRMSDLFKNINIGNLLSQTLFVHLIKVEKELNQIY